MDKEEANNNNEQSLVAATPECICALQCMFLTLLNRISGSCWLRQGAGGAYGAHRPFCLSAYVHEESSQGSLSRWIFRLICFSQLHVLVLKQQFKHTHDATVINHYSANLEQNSCRRGEHRLTSMC